MACYHRDTENTEKNGFLEVSPWRTILSNARNFMKTIQRNILIAGAIALMAFIGATGIMRKPDGGTPAPTLPAATIEQIKKEQYDAGYANGYNIAKEENAAAYRRGYETAQHEIGSGALTRFGIVGFLAGLLVGAGAFVGLKRREFAAWFEAWRMRRALKKTFRRIPEGLSPDMAALAQQMARTYIALLTQLRSGKGYLVDRYAKEWRGMLGDMMGKSVRLFELTRELETVRAQVDEKELTRTIRALSRAVQNPDYEDAARNSAVRSLQRARQTQQDARQAEQNLTQCKGSLQDMCQTLESLRLKVSNVKVNSQQPDALDQLSSELAIQMNALEEALSEVS